jgi:dUTP pyrophosphatase
MALNQIKVKKLNPRAQLPKYETAGSAAFDVRVLVEEGQHSTVSPGESIAFGTGLAFEIPVGYVMLVFSRSGMGFMNDLRLSNCVGVIDSDYRGELKVKIAKDGPFDLSYPVKDQERMVQCIIVEASQVGILEVDELSTTDRGEKGLGSTGQI